MWERRRQIVDRVYEISIRGRKYILKEMKTARNTDTFGTGHQSGNLSKDEFAIAKKYQSHGRFDSGIVELNWEKPTAYAIYPDGFQFCAMTCEAGLIDRNVRALLALAIITHRSQFETEYRYIIELAQKHTNNPYVVLESGSNVSRLKRAMRLLGLSKKTPISISFDDYAKIRAERMISQAIELLEQSMINCGYADRDITDYAFRVTSTELVKLNSLGLTLIILKQFLLSE